MAPIDADTRSMIRTAADERAAAAGMVFDAERAAWACDWIETHCCLYEGDRAGQPLILLPCWRDFFQRMYGWMRWSDHWGQWIRRFTHAAFWGAKKNGKTPCAAAHNLYMLCGDGEPGQKVYMMASGGQQARIAQRHAVMMVKQSPRLDCEQGGDCKINNTTFQITHLPTGSICEVVTGDDQRNANKKHGYNGSVTIDECHVVNRLMMDAVGRAGKSRKEPLQVSFSTAGTDPSSVGHERFQYGRQVNKGERDDPHFLHVEYSAPDAVTDADIEERLEEYGKAANPAWGTLINPEEFQADWERSKGEPRKVAIFKQESLNLWVGSTNQWLDLAGWERGRREYTLADLAGRDCFLGFDLSRTQDMTGAVFVFPWGDEDGEHPETIRLWPMTWLPEETARERDHLFPFRTWAKGGHITLTEGGVVDYAKVKADLRKAITEHRLNVICLYYDATYANEPTQALHEGESLGKEHVSGVVEKREAVRQNWQLTSLSKELERRVKAGIVQHPGNPVLTWQVGHVEVRADVNQNIRPAKPSPRSGKSIDLIAATVDAMAGVIAYSGWNVGISAPLVM
jgi:phage terminase large subunit-like protein